MSNLLPLSRMARELGVAKSWLRKQAASGSVPCLKAGSRFLFNAAAVRESLARRAAEPQAVQP